MIKDNKFRVISLMSGTSLDGLDIVDVSFHLNHSQKWDFYLKSAGIYNYPQALSKQLKNAFNISIPEILKLNNDLGLFYAEQVNQFLTINKIDKTEIDFIVSHGQTVFHQPDKGYTLQIGNGHEIAVNTQIPNVNDFRSKDVALGGNGAPLIPVADFMLFKKLADSFLNLGGFSNFSFKKKDKVYSYDVCPVNIIINHLMKKVGLDYDEKGVFGSMGKVNEDLLEELNALEFYQRSFPKSLGWEWVNEKIIPVLEIEKELKNQIRTFYEHIAFQIAKSIEKSGVPSVLVTGGGAKNTFLIKRIKALSKSEIIIPNKSMIDFKEAIGFAFLGLLRWKNEINVWASVTGAKRDSCSGVVIYP